MDQAIKCLWCASSLVTKTLFGLPYHQCQSCEFIWLDPSQRLDLAQEKARYEKHQNIVTDLGYQDFVRPLEKAILKKYNSQHLGLDYGSGKDSAIHYLLKQRQYQLEKYDPFFVNHPERLQAEKYDYIVVCEVAEHFYDPCAEFEKLKSLLKSGGTLFVMTSLWSQDVDFINWSYRRDSTHVCFYSVKTFSTQFTVEVEAPNLIILHDNRVT